MKRALISGTTGQDGSFLAEMLLAKGYQVHGIVRRASTFRTERLEAFYTNQHEAGTARFLHCGNVADGAGFRCSLESACPGAIYNLAAQSHVRVSFDQAEYTADVPATDTLRILEG